MDRPVRSLSDQSRPYTTREFLYLLGLELGKHAKEDGIVSVAGKAGIPLYCPAIADSSIGIGIAANRYEGGNRFTFDVIGDVVETARIVAESHASGVIYFGGGTPKNFVQQTEVTAIIMNTGVTGHNRHPVRHGFPALGRALGLHFRRGAELGENREGCFHGHLPFDSTIAMPILVSAILENPELIASSIGQNSSWAGNSEWRPDAIPIYQVDAFANRLFAGNPAAVCPLDEWLPDDKLQSIALENNLAETAFFVRDVDARYKLRWFTPTVEVDLCGHATLASAFVIFTERITAAAKRGSRRAAANWW